MSLSPKKRFVRKQRSTRTEGAVSVEYVVIMVLVALTSIIAWGALQDSVEEDADEQYQTFGYPAS